MARSIPRTSRRAIIAIALSVVTAATTVSAAEAPDEESGEAIEVERDRPLPERWHARRIDEPIFESRMYVVEAGPADATPVLLVHGLGQSGYQDWWETIEALEADYRVIALDLPGFARSTEAQGQMSPARYARLLDWLGRRLDLDGIQLVGHSMGAAISLYYASTYPDRVDNVVLVDAAGILQRMAFLRAVASAQVQNYGLPEFIADRVRGLFQWGTGVVERLLLSSEVDVVELLRRSDSAWDALLSDRPNVNAAIALLETDFSRALARFDRPATVIWGEHDSVAPIRTGYMLHGVLPDNRLRVIEGAGHIPMRSDTGVFLEHLHDALATPPSGGVPARGRTGGGDPDFTCRGRDGETLSGEFDRIVVEDCPGMRLVDVTARQLTITGSRDTRLRHVTVDRGPSADLPAIDITTSDVIATDLEAAGAPAVRIDGGRVDIAGGVLTAADGALAVERQSTVVLSVSRVRSGVYDGFLHGAVKAADAVLDDTPKLRPPPPDGERVAAPPPAETHRYAFYSPAPSALRLHARSARSR
ncbi:MAG: alpha/beta fold hydrolase [Halofilum sp. (in: g-proteobacteria)]